MTTNRPPPTSTLVRAAKAFQLARVVQGLVRWGVTSAGGLLVLLLVDNFLHLPQALRLPLALAFGGFVAVDFYRKVIKPLLQPISPSHAARLLEIRSRHRGQCPDQRISVRA